MAEEYIKVLRRRMKLQEAENTQRATLTAMMVQNKVPRIELEDSYVDIVQGEVKLKTKKKKDASKSEEEEHESED